MTASSGLAIMWADRGRAVGSGRDGQHHRHRGSDFLNGSPDADLIEGLGGNDDGAANLIIQVTLVDPTPLGAADFIL
jgi:hypothetical protein